MNLPRCSTGYGGPIVSSVELASGARLLEYALDEVGDVIRGRLSNEDSALEAAPAPCPLGANLHLAPFWRRRRPVDSVMSP